MARSVSSLLAGLGLAVILAACGSGSPGSTSPRSVAPASATPAATSTAPASPSTLPSATPVGTSIPGFEGWTILTPGAVSISVEPGSTPADTSLLMTLTHRALWFQSQRGVLFSTPTSGDFRVSATVETARTSDPSKPPGGDGTVQFAGVMARAEGVTENYVFIVVGSYTTGLAIETKSTRNNASRFDDARVESATAELKLCRSGTSFTLAARPSGASEWSVMASYDRPDLAGTLDVGANIYSDSTPDITARLRNLVIEPLAAGEAC